jgi:uncharacterized membrane protein
MACGFLLMAIDEAWSLHERTMRPMRRLLGGEELGVLYYAWVVPGFALVLALAAVFARFLWGLPRQTQRRFAIAAALYLGGALGVELLAGRFNELHGLQALKGQIGMVHLQYSFLATVEESLEMAGLVVFIGTLLDLLTHRKGELRVRLVENKSGG